ncbi:hypothetical protein [Methanosarcina sp.]|nr:hypothetical protein [Methanosarcina sp.]MDW5549793.1 hypothetical protein [Methanosarcina sp.]
MSDDGGGGFIMSPAQYWLLQETGLQHDIAKRIAFGTILFWGSAK